MGLSFSKNLNDYYHEYHGIKNSFHVHGFGMVSHHFREWLGSNWMGLVIYHQKLIILLSNKKT